MKIELCDYKEIQIEPDFIYNRFDLLYKDAKLIVVSDEVEKFYIPFYCTNSKAYLGLYLRKLPDELFCEVIKFVFSMHKVNLIYVMRCRNNYKNKPRATNHFRIELPDSSEVLMSYMGKKGRYNYKRSRKLLEQQGKVEIHHRSQEEIPDEWVYRFYELKQQTHKRLFGKTANEYLERYHVSDAYVMTLDGKIISVLFSCEQCECVYLENLSYDTEYSKYSVGFSLYVEFLERIIEKQKKQVFLGGGNLDYKKRLGSIEESVYDGYIYKSNLSRIIYGSLHKLSMMKGRISLLK